jgi:hypothetical protein
VTALGSCSEGWCLRPDEPEDMALFSALL